jgi:putative acetyltransferase
MIEIALATAPSDWRHATALLHDYVEWVQAVAHVDPLAQQPEMADELVDLRRHYVRPDRVLFVARDEGDPVGIVAIWDHGDGTAELKRMYVRPVARGSGVADRLIACVLDVAIARGCHAVWLETLRESMGRAIAVYRRNGFTELPETGRRLVLDDAVVMEQRLPALPASRALGGGSCGA